jgi:hypothetical protein
VNPVKFLFTDDHRWPVEVNRTFVKGKWYGGERKMVPSTELNTSHKIPLTGEFQEEHSILSPRLARILGWVVTDGYHRIRNNYMEMMVYQSPRKHLDEIVELLGTTPRKPHPDTGVVCVPVAIEDVKRIRAIFESKGDLVAIVCHLSRNSAEAMWDAMFKAEGCTSERGNQNFAQDPEKNPDVLDAFQILCYMTGRAANLSTKGCNVRRQKSFGVKEGMGLERYKGKIWCPRTPTGTWVMRHDGDVIITGNTFMRKNMPLQLETLAQHPRSISPQLRIGAGTANSFVPEHLRSGVAIPLGQENEEGQQRFISQLGLPVEEAFERLKVSPGNIGDTIRNTILAYAGGLNPLIKGPLEQLSNTQFFSGRKLSDLRPQGVVGGLAGVLDPDQQHPIVSQVLSQALANTPATRFLTATDKILDPRKPLWAKALNLGTGVRISDVDLEKSRAIETRKVLEALLRQHPQVATHTSLYVPPAMQSQLSPELISQLQIYARTQRDALAASKRTREKATR